MGTLGATPSQASALVSGDITADTTWSLAGSPYYVADDVTVVGGATLTIEPGVEVRVGPYLVWIQSGVLDARGTDADPITFARSGSERWGALFIGSAARATLAHVSIDGAASGLSADGPIIASDIDIRCGPASSGLLMRSGTLTRGSINGPPESCYAWLEGDAVVEDSAFSERVFMNGGHLRDSTVSGATLPYAVEMFGRATLEGSTISGNHQAGVYATDASTIIDSTITANAGHGVVFGGSGNPSYPGALRGNAITGNGGDGVSITDGWAGQLDASDNLIGGNLGAGIRNSGSNSFRRNSIVGNARYAIEQGRPYGADLDATDSWWDTTDPELIGLQILDDTDDRGLGTVTSVPFATAPIADAPTPPADGFAIASLVTSTLVPDRTQASQGEEVGFTLTLRNLGGADATAARATIPIPQGTTYVAGSVTGSGARYEPSPPRIIWDGTTLTAGGTSLVGFRLAVEQDVLDGTKIKVPASIQDGQGNTFEPSAGFGVLRGPDLQPPDTRITASPTDPVNSPDATFSFSATESGSTFACSLDSAVYAACTPPKTYTGLSVGAHTFAVRATDTAGNTDPSPATSTWTIDTTAPAITYVSRTAPNRYGWNNTDVTLTWRCSDGGTGPIAETVEAILTDEAADQSATGTCRDRAGNTASDMQGGVDRASGSINIDKTAPVVTINSPYAGGDIRGTARDALSGLEPPPPEGYSPVRISLCCAPTTSNDWGGWHERPTLCTGADPCVGGAALIGWRVTPTRDLIGPMSATAIGYDLAGNLGTSEVAVLTFLPRL